MRFQTAWKTWKRVAYKIGTFQARLLLTIFYCIVVLPFGLATRAGSDSLHIKKLPERWRDHPDDVYNLDWAKRQ